MPEHSERAVAGVDQTGSGAHDGVQRLIQIQPGGHRQHGLDQAVHPVPGVDDLIDPILHLAEQLPQPQLRERLTHRVGIIAGFHGHSGGPGFSGCTFGRPPHGIEQYIPTTTQRRLLSVQLVAATSVSTVSG